MFSKLRQDPARPPGPSDQAERAPVGPGPSPSLPPAPAAEVIEPPAAAPPRRAEARRKGSFIAADVILEGDVTATGDLTVEGRVKGNIKAVELVLGESAVLLGDVIAETLKIHGRAQGQLAGRDIFLAPTAQVDGVVAYGNLSMDSGARLDGSVMRNATAAEPPPSPPPPSPTRQRTPAAKLPEADKTE